MKHHIPIIAASMLLATAAADTDESKLTLDRLFTKREFSEQTMPAFQWSKSGDHYFSLEKSETSKAGKDLVRTEAASGEKSFIATAAELTPDGEEKPLDVRSFQFSENESKVLLFTNTVRGWRIHTYGDYWLLNPTTKQLHKLGGDAAPSSMMFAKFSPDASKVAYVRENNLYVQDLTSFEISALTTDGSDTIINGSSDWVNEEEFRLRDGFRWSPDGKRLLFWQFDTSGVDRFTMIDESQGSVQKIKTFPYPTAGTKNSAIRLATVSAAGGAITWLALPGEPRDHYIPRAEWNPAGTHVIAQQLNRLQNQLRMFRADATSGTAATLVSESSDAWIEYKNPVGWAGDSFVFLSEKSGWRKAYIVAQDGSQSPITDGDFDVIDVDSVDPEGGWLYHSASPDNPNSHFLFRTKLSGGKPERLTPEGLTGWHTYEISSSGKWAMHTQSSITSPPVVTLISLPDHKPVRVLLSQEKLLDRIAKLDLPKTEFLKVDLKDGKSLDAWMMKPSDLDPAKMHPLFTYVYGEPLGQTVKDAWAGPRNLWHLMLAQQGYIVVAIAGEGSNSPRGRDFRKATYRHLGTATSQQQADAVRSLLKRFPFLDPERVGVWGWSGGGSSSIDAIVRYPELYRTAISVAPLPDRRLYNTIYQERYMGLPQDNAEGYEHGSPITHADKLTGNLLLIHGTADDNVHYRGTAQFMDRLIAEGKHFTVMPYPQRDHAINTGKGTSRHFYGLMTRYLHEHLPLR